MRLAMTAPQRLLKVEPAFKAANSGQLVQSVDILGPVAALLLGRTEVAQKAQYV